MPDTTPEPTMYTTLDQLTTDLTARGWLAADFRVTDLGGGRVRLADDNAGESYSVALADVADAETAPDFTGWLRASLAGNPEPAVDLALATAADEADTAIQHAAEVLKDMPTGPERSALAGAHNALLRARDIIDARCGGSVARHAAVAAAMKQDNR